MNYITKSLFNLIPKYLHLPIEYNYCKLMKSLEQELIYLENSKLSKKRAIDIGANKGFYTYVFSNLCEIVEVFEPQPWCTDGIQSFSNKFNKKINIHNCALSDTNGFLTLNIPVLRGKIRTTLATGLASFRECKSEHQSIYTPVYTLDEFNFKDVAFIKIDVEGHERNVIKGARETILREKPLIFIEIEQRHLDNCLIEDVLSEIIQFGYKGFFLYHNDLLDLDKFSREKHQSPNCYNRTGKSVKSKRLFQDEYVNNFIFIPN